MVTTNNQTFLQLPCFIFQVNSKPAAKRRKGDDGNEIITASKNSTSAEDEEEEASNEDQPKPEVGQKRKFSEIANGNGSATKEKVKNAPFRRVISEDIVIPKHELRDNTYKNFDTWGAKANQDLIVTKGKGFRSEKTKKKRGSYRGGAINVGVNSIRFDDSD